MVKEMSIYETKVIFEHNIILYWHSPGDAFQWQYVKKRFTNSFVICRRDHNHSEIEAWEEGISISEVQVSPGPAVNTISGYSSPKNSLRSLPPEGHRYLLSFFFRFILTICTPFVFLQFCYSFTSFLAIVLKSHWIKGHFTYVRFS